MAAVHNTRIHINNTQNSSSLNSWIVLRRLSSKSESLTFDVEYIFRELITNSTNVDHYFPEVDHLNTNYKVFLSPLARYLSIFGEVNKLAIGKYVLFTFRLRVNQTCIRAYILCVKITVKQTCIIYIF